MTDDIETLVLKTPERIIPEKIIPSQTFGEFEQMGSVHETRLQEVLKREFEVGYNKFLITKVWYDEKGGCNAGNPGYLYKMMKSK